MAHFSELPKDLPPHLEVPRRSGLTVNEFIEEYVKPNKPVILTDVVTQWPAVQLLHHQAPAMVGSVSNKLSRVVASPVEREVVDQGGPDQQVPRHSVPC
jgi:hypothetical protein